MNIRTPIRDLDAAEKQLERDTAMAAAALQNLVDNYDLDELDRVDRALLARWLHEVDLGLRNILDEIREEEVEELEAIWSAT